MTIEELVNYFVCASDFHQMTGMPKYTYYMWKKKGFVPMEGQYELEKITHGRLKASILDHPIKYRKLHSNFYKEFGAALLDYVERLLELRNKYCGIYPEGAEKILNYEVNRAYGKLEKTGVIAGEEK